MIQRIRRRFIRIALLVLGMTMVLLALVINVANWANTRAELSETLGYLSHMRGPAGRLDGPRGRREQGVVNRANESRFFSATLDADGTLQLSDTLRMADYDSDELSAIAARALGSGRSGGVLGDYLYSVSDADNGARRAVFLNCATRFSALRRLALISAIACAGGIGLAWLLVSLFSRRAIQPLIDNAVQQKQFITDAGHELKTPLTVISANMDVLALEAGENDWIRSTRKQVSNMQALVGELIYLSRLDEEDARADMRPLDLSKLVREAAEPFEGMAEFAGKTLGVHVEDGITVQGDGAMLSRLVSVLCDNAVKYAPDGDDISIRLEEDGRWVRLTTENGLREPMSPETLSHLFDRFYRADASRSKERGGFGIGLSVARAIAEKHGGSIQARQADGNRIRFTVTLPANGKRMNRYG